MTCATFSIVFCSLQANLDDPEKCKLAKARKDASASTTSETASTPKYRDRALERREAYGQPDAPMPQAKKKRYAEGPAPPPPPPPPPVQPNKDGLEETNKGSQMLKAMGWSSGAGLGASSSGRVDPIQAYVRAQGVGLGAAKGVVAGKYEDSSKGYAESVKDKARERLNAEQL